MEKLTIIKIGGNVIDDTQSLEQFLADFSELKGYKLLVHGGGKTATEVAKQMKLTSQMVNGRRVTDDKMIDVVSMTYAGLINKRIVAQLQAHGVNALGLTGVDGNLILADKRIKADSIDFGWVGDPKSVNQGFLLGLIENGIVPVLAPLTHDGKGHLLNTNADTISSALAVALSKYVEVELNYCFDLIGVLKEVNNPQSLIKELRMDEYEEIKKMGSVSQGMIPKLDNAFDAVNRGVSTVRIMSYHSISKLKNKGNYEFTAIH